MAATVHDRRLGLPRHIGDCSSTIRLAPPQPMPERLRVIQLRENALRHIRMHSGHVSHGYHRLPGSPPEAPKTQPTV